MSSIIISCFKNRVLSIERISHRQETEAQMARWTPSCILPELASVVEFRMCQRSLFTPSFFASVQAVYNGPSYTWGFFLFVSTPRFDMRLLDFVLQIHRVLFFFLFVCSFVWLFVFPVTSSSRRPSLVDLIRAGESEPSFLPSPFSCTLLQALHINLKLTEAIARQVCSQCFQAGLFQPLSFYGVYTI